MMAVLCQRQRGAAVVSGEAPGPFPQEAVWRPHGQCRGLFQLLCQDEGQQGVPEQKYRPPEAAASSEAGQPSHDCHPSPGGKWGQLPGEERVSQWEDVYPQQSLTEVQKVSQKLLAAEGPLTCECAPLEGSL